VRAAAPALAHGYGGQISERHHVHKKDAPSGTAIALQRELEQACGSQVKIHSEREGEVTGTHSLELTSAGDRIMLTHEALSRRTFAEGAVLAAEWIADKQGFYDFKDIGPLIVQIGLSKDYSTKMKLRGCGTALVTPFRQDGSIDEPALRALVRWQVESGIDFLVPCGTTGETPTLTHDEWLRVVDITVEVADGRVPIMAGATSNNTSEAVAKAKEISSRKGVDFVLTATPYYNKPSQEGVYQHFRKIAEVSQKPLMLYNIAGRTGLNIETSTLLRLAELPNIVAVKEASGNIAQIADVCASVPEDFLVFSGDDAITLAVIGLGGVGIVSVASNEIPAEMAGMTHAALSNKWDTARLLFRRYLPLMQANFLESNPSPAKAVLSMMGRLEENLRLPLVPVKQETRAKLEKIAAEVGLLHAPVSVP
jgi:4-hydroxy-tetrahydrodipicolinate synthase